MLLCFLWQGVFECHPFPSGFHGELEMSLDKTGKETKAKPVWRLNSFGYFPVPFLLLIFPLLLLHSLDHLHFLYYFHFRRCFALFMVGMSVVEALVFLMHRTAPSIFSPRGAKELLVVLAEMKKKCLG